MDILSARNQELDRATEREKALQASNSALQNKLIALADVHAANAAARATASTAHQRAAEIKPRKLPMPPFAIAAGMNGHLDAARIEQLNRRRSGVVQPPPAEEAR
jgi:hypothetical protein